MHPSGESIHNETTRSFQLAHSRAITAARYLRGKGSQRILTEDEILLPHWYLPSNVRLEDVRELAIESGRRTRAVFSLRRCGGAPDFRDSPGESLFGARACAGVRLEMRRASLRHRCAMHVS
jgi:hypothetical protein